MTGVGTRIGPADEHEWRYHESLIQADFERCHPDDTFDDLKRRARFSKEDQGLLLGWMRLAAQRATEKQESETVSPRRPIAA
jgi:hypothetical protein